MIRVETIRQWWSIFRGEGKLTEARVLDKGKTYSGYFTNVEDMIAALRPYENAGIYSPINTIKAGCYGKTQHDVIIANPKTTTNDADIEGRDIILIDFDPKRTSDTNSTDEEKSFAWEKVQKVYAFLRDEGFSHPVVADSANGYHLYYKVALANTPENTELVKNFLKALDMLFSDDKVDIDTSVFNAGRIAKIIGTTSNKGASTVDRPQRESFFIQVPDTWSRTDIAYIKKVADMLPKQEKPSKFNGYSSDKFNIESFIHEHNIEITKRVRFGSGEKLILRECPFDSNHKAPDSALFVMDNGAIGFKCLHNSCSGYTWRDVRLRFDPTAYDHKDPFETSSRPSYHSRYSPQSEEPVVLEEVQEKGKKWLSMADIRYINPASLPFVPTGIHTLDRKIMGLMMGDVTILSGLSGCGKTSLINFMTLNVIQKGYKVAVWSGELQDFRFQSWIDQMAAGKNFVRAKEGYDNLYFAPRDVCESVNKWLDGKLFLYNNNYSNRFSQIFADVKDVVEREKVSMVVLDNLTALSLDAYDGEKNEQQKQFINDLKTYAKQKNIHVLLVCHPRKEASFQLLRKESISGSSDLTNLCDNVFIAHRVGRDFEKRGKEFFGEKISDYCNYDEVIEVCKNRSVGVQDFLVGLYFERESRRFKNDVAEHIVYGWQEEPIQTEIHYTQDIPVGKDFSEVDDLPF